MLIKQKYNGDDEDSQNIFRNIKLRINQIDEKLLSNYQQNYESCRIEIEALDSEIKKIIDYINFDFTTNVFLERLMLFTNKY
jgi:ABC-type Zn uptake system ZnuABC Zn-binding protein ZnuA